MNCNGSHGALCVCSSMEQLTDVHVFFFSSRRRHTRFDCDWSSDVCSSDLGTLFSAFVPDVRKSDVDPIGTFVAGVIREQLRSEGLPEDLFGSLREVRAARTKIGRASCRERV